MNSQIFHFNKYDLKGHWRSQMVICLSGNLRKFFITHSFMNWFWKKYYIKTIIINTQIFNFNKYDLIGHWRSKKGHLSFLEFEKILPNTFIYESILIKIYMNTNIIMNTPILKVTKGHFYVYFNLNLRSYGQLFVLVFFLASVFV